MTQNQPQGQQIQIRAKDEDLRGAYSNLMQISHSPEEFVMDFFNISPNPQQGGMLVSRIILSPGHFKRMLEAVKDNLEKYEQQHGAITPAEAPSGGIGFQPKQ